MSNNNSITGNTITNTGVGIVYLNSNNNTITGNNIINSDIQDILQVDPTGIVMSNVIFNCGPASLATVMQNLGITVSQDELAAIAGTDYTGTTMYGLAQAAQEVGFIAKGLKLTVEQLRTNNIVYLTINGEGHFSIFKSINGTTVYLADSDFGNINMTIANFTAAFIQDTVNGYGYVLVVTNDPNNEQLSINTTLTDDEMKNIKGTRYKKSTKSRIKVTSTITVKVQNRYVKVNVANMKGALKGHKLLFSTNPYYGPPNVKIRKVNPRHEKMFLGGLKFVGGIILFGAGAVTSPEGVGFVLMFGGRSLMSNGATDIYTSI